MRKDIEFPDCWEEVKPDEWVYLLKLLDDKQRADELLKRYKH